MASSFIWTGAVASDVSLDRFIEKVQKTNAEYDKCFNWTNDVALILSLLKKKLANNGTLLFFFCFW